MAAVRTGWREWVALPMLQLPRIRAKLDTGARSSALHVERQWRFTHAGAPWVGFEVKPGAHGVLVAASAAIVDERLVTDSGGHRTLRAFVCTRVRLAGVECDIEMNLTDRRGMRFPLLLGRTALAQGFMVDPAASYLHRRKPRTSIVQPPASHEPRR